MTLPDHQATLVALAMAARLRAYAPYSRFTVGAALQTSAGEVFAGANVENASYGLTICAERAAVAAAVTAGHRQFAALVLVSDGGVPPCGACRQVLAEFCDDLPVLLVDAANPGRAVTMHLAQLLPHGYRARP